MEITEDGKETPTNKKHLQFQDHASLAKANLIKYTPVRLSYCGLL